MGIKDWFKTGWAKLGALLVTLGAIKPVWDGILFVLDLPGRKDAAVSYAHFLPTLAKAWWFSPTLIVVGFLLVWIDVRRRVKKQESDLPKHSPAPEMVTDEQKKLMRRRAGITPKPLPEQHPDVLLEWDSGQPWNKDMIRLRNRGMLPALNIRLGHFSWSELTWHFPIEVQSLDPDAPEVTREAEFNCALSNGHEIGYMNRVLVRLDSDERAPLSLSATFSDLRGNIFERQFILKRGISRKGGVIVSLGELQII